MKLKFFYAFGIDEAITLNYKFKNLFTGFLARGGALKIIRKFFQFIPSALSLHITLNYNFIS